MVKFKYPCVSIYFSYVQPSPSQLSLVFSLQEFPTSPSLTEPRPKSTGAWQNTHEIARKEEREGPSWKLSHVSLWHRGRKQSQRGKMSKFSLAFQPAVPIPLPYGHLACSSVATSHPLTYPEKRMKRIRERECVASVEGEKIKQKKKKKKNRQKKMEVESGWRRIFAAIPGAQGLRVRPKGHHPGHDAFGSGRRHPSRALRVSCSLPHPRDVHFCSLARLQGRRNMGWSARKWRNYIRGRKRRV